MLKEILALIHLENFKVPNLINKITLYRLQSFEKMSLSSVDRSKRWLSNFFFIEWQGKLLKAFKKYSGKFVLG